MDISEMIAQLTDHVKEINGKKYILNTSFENALLGCDFSVNRLNDLHGALSLRQIEVVEEIPRNKIAGHDLLLIGKRRYYKDDLSKRSYNYECTTPFRLEFCNISIQENAWTDMIRILASILLEMFPKTNEELFQYRVFWTKNIQFSSVKKTNFKPIKSDLFVNCNHTALHSCWFIQDLLEFFGVDKEKAILYIHRPSSTEPKEVREVFLQDTLKKFKVFLQEQHNKSEESCVKIISIISRLLSKLLKDISKSYDDMFLFDDYLIMYNYCNKMKTTIKNCFTFTEKQKTVLERYIGYLLEFYKDFSG